MPKSKVRKKPTSTARPTAAASSTAGRGLTPSPPWYPVVMAAVLLLGLAWMVVYYLTQSGTDPEVPGMVSLGVWNFAVGFGVMLLGLVMAVRWR